MVKLSSEHQRAHFALDYLLAWLFDLNQDGEDEQQQHHPGGHADHRAVRLSDLVENAFALFLWRKTDDRRARERGRARVH